MKLAVLSAADSWYLKDLRRAVGDKYEVAHFSFAELTGEVAASGESVGCGSSSFADFDAVIVRSMPPGSLEQVVFRMNALSRLEATGIPVINSVRSLETAIDKYLSAAKLAKLGTPMPRTIACQTVDDAMIAFEDLGGDVVIKPVFGGEGRGITRVSDPDLGLRAFKLLAQMNAVILLQQYIPHHGFDIRLLVVGGRVFGMKRVNPHDWRTNVSRGAATERFDVDDHLEQLAREAADETGALIAGVDILPGKDGEQYLLEVNAVPGWKALSSTLGIDIAAEVIKCVEVYAWAMETGRGL